ncbi:MAG: IcmP [uncultured bacterium]|nr:MAG: IcmP [uncultured bacterium]
MWQGTQYLQPHIKGLFAAFAARLNADSVSAAKLIKQFNLSCRLKNIDMRHVDEILKKYENTKLVQRITQKHAYVYTVMASMLEGAREDGVQASADFLWLKPVDRRLWYVLNNVGRQTAFVEIAGAFAHWKAEKEAGIKLLTPMVEEATKALEIVLKEIVYKPDEVNT